MYAKRRTHRRGFTLVELLTSIAIISLLIGLLVPAIAQARYTARRVRTQSLLASLGTGCEMFHKDMGVYPQSRGGNPFETTSYPARQPPTVALSGAQWLLLQLVGADLRGFAKQTPEKYYDSRPANGDGSVNQLDWNDWYGLTPSRTDFRRWGPYMEISGSVAKSPEQHAKEGAVTLTPALTAGNGAAGASDWNNGRLPYAVDSFNSPVLYFAANEGAQQPFTEWNGDTPVLGRYDLKDNAAITGFGATQAGIDLGASKPHNMATLGWASSAPLKQPDPNTFAAAVYDEKLFEQNRRGNEGKVWPYRPDTFLLVAPGRDGVYGTTDDITNYQ